MFIRMPDRRLMLSFPPAESHPEKVLLASSLIIAKLKKTKTKTRVEYRATRMCCVKWRQIRSDSKFLGGVDEDLLIGTFVYLINAATLLLTCQNQAVTTRMNRLCFPHRGGRHLDLWSYSALRECGCLNCSFLQCFLKPFKTQRFSV